MPSLISRGAMSGKGFGLTGQAGSGSTLTSVTFTADGNWIAPASTTNVVTASGKGAAGVSDYVGNVANVISGQIHLSSPLATNPPYAQWSNAYNNYQYALSQLNLSYPTYGPSNLTNGYVVVLQSNDYWYAISGNTTNLSGTYLTGYTVYTLGSPQTSGNITYAGTSGLDEWYIPVSGYIRGGAGASATALGQTFPGGGYSGTYPNGTGSAASTTTYSNIAVTPNASYPIVVPSGGFVTLEYYV